LFHPAKGVDDGVGEIGGLRAGKEKLDVSARDVAIAASVTEHSPVAVAATVKAAVDPRPRVEVTVSL
jgi:hypothetical protein